MIFSATSGVSDASDRDRGMALRLAILTALGLTVAGCANDGRLARQNGSVDRYNTRYGVSSSPRVVEEGRPVPRGGGVYRVGRPYMVAGRRYVPFEKREGHTEVGVASWYGRQFHGRLTANGEVYDMNALSAAHRTMPMPSYARVTNMRNGHSIIVRVNDRGPFHANRVIDLSSRASHLLDFRGHGVSRVKVEYVGRAPLEGSDDRMLLATLRTDGSPAPRPAGTSGTMIASAEPTFVPQAPAQPAVAENSGVVTQMAAMPLPPERPFELGLSQANAVTVARAAATAPSAPVMAAAPTPPARPEPVVTTAAAPQLAAASRPLSASAFTAAPAAPAAAFSAMPGAPQARPALGVGGLY